MKAFATLLFNTAVMMALAAASSPVHGQGVTAPGTRGRSDPVQRELQRRFESEAIERVLAESPRRRAELHLRTTLVQIREDFLRIQVLDDQLHKFATRNEPFDLKAVAKHASEITQRAERLRQNLVLPGTKKNRRHPGPGVDMGIEQLRVAILDLSKAINAFVENPVFEKSGVIDAKLSMKAAGDLDRIIEVSWQLKRSSEKLKRAGVRT